MLSLRAAPLLFLLLLSGCGDEEGGEPKPPEAAPGATPPATSEEFTETMAAELGAADLVPEDCSLYAANLRLGEQWKIVSESRAYGMLLDLPTLRPSSLRRELE